MAWSSWCITPAAPAAAADGSMVSGTAVPSVADSSHLIGEEERNALVGLHAFEVESEYDENWGALGAGTPEPDLLGLANARRNSSPEAVAVPADLDRAGASGPGGCCKPRKPPQGDDRDDKGPSSSKPKTWPAHKRRGPPPTTSADRLAQPRVSPRVSPQPPPQLPPLERPSEQSATVYSKDGWQWEDACSGRTQPRTGSASVRLEPHPEPEPEPEPEPQLPAHKTPTPPGMARTTSAVSARSCPAVRAHSPDSLMMLGGPPPNVLAGHAPLLPPPQAAVATTMAATAQPAARKPAGPASGAATAWLAQTTSWELQQQFGAASSLRPPRSGSRDFMRRFHETVESGQPRARSDGAAAYGPPDKRSPMQPPPLQAPKAAAAAVGPSAEAKQKRQAERLKTESPALARLALARKARVAATEVTAAPAQSDTRTAPATAAATVRARSSSSSEEMAADASGKGGASGTHYMYGDRRRSVSAREPRQDQVSTSECPQNHGREPAGQFAFPHHTGVTINRGAAPDPAAAAVYGKAAVAAAAADVLADENGRFQVGQRWNLRANQNDLGRMALAAASPFAVRSGNQIVTNRRYELPATAGGVGLPPPMQPSMPAVRVIGGSVTARPWADRSRPLHALGGEHKVVATALRKVTASPLVGW